MAEVIEVRNSATDIDNDTTSVIGLRHLDEIKAYVDGRLGNVSGELSDELKDYFDDQMEKARDFITNDTTNRLDDLKKLLEDAIAAGDLNAIRDIELKIDALNSDFTNKLEAIDAINEQVERLNGKYGDLSNSIFSPGEIDELIKTAFIEGTYISDDRIETPNLFTTKLVALIANFGKIQAANIEGGAISGHTIESNNNIPGQYDENGNPIPLWKIENDGSGWLASKNIEWNERGDVRFGDDVSLSWKNVDNEGNPIYDALKDLENAQNDLRQSLNDGIGNVVANWMDDNMLSPMEIKELKNELERMTADYNTMEKYLNEIIALYESAANSDIDKDIKIKYRDDLKAGRDSLKQSYDSAKTVCENYINAVKDSVGSIKIDPEKYGDLNKINEYYIKRDEVLKTYYDANSFYVTDNRFGSKLTYIGEDGIYSGKISGDQITGWRLRGLTMESAKTTKLPDYVSWYDYNHNATNEEDAFDGKTGGIGPTWQISKDGDGHLAEGAISWAGKRVTLSPDVRITWASVTDGDDEVDKKIDEKIKIVEDNIDAINDVMDKFNKRMHDLASDVGNINITGEGGGEWPTPDMGEIEDRLDALEGEVIHITNNAIYSENIIGQNIVGKSIVGINLFAGVGEEDKNGENPAAFGVYRNGNGFLADGAFKWSKDPNTGKWKVLLGDGVTIDWGPVKGPEGSGGGSGDGSGVGKFKSIIFCRTDNIPNTPEGGDWYNPSDVTGNDNLGNIVNWEDGVPYGTATLWSSTRIFATDDSGDVEWSTPRVMTDSPDFEVIYSKEEKYIEPVGDFYRDDDGEIKGWLASNGTWSDDADENTIWMAINEKTGGEWKGWKISKIKGEKGEDGTSINTKGTLESPDDLLNITKPTLGDAYIINGELWVYTGADTTDDVNGFSNCGSFKGEPGEAAYLHIKYATIVEFDGDEVKNVILTDNDGESSIGAAWIGVGHTTSKTNETGTDPIDDSSLKTIYKWSEFLTSENVNEVVKSSLGAYHITSNHIGGKTIDNNVKTADGSSNFVNLPTGLTYRLFEKDANGYDTEESKIVEVGKDTDYNNETVLTGPSWQIRNDGAGHLAAGHIWWDANGNLTANINGKFSGGNDGGVGDDVMTWDANNIYIKKNLVFDENSTIKWANSSENESANKPTGEGGGVTEEKVEEISTEITKKTITTDKLYARDLTVKKLNTGISIKDDGTVDNSTFENNRIEVDGNQLLAYDENNKNTLVISGDSIEMCLTNDGTVSTGQFAGPIGNGYSSGNIGTITLSCDANSVITIPERTYEVWITDIARDTSFSGVSCTIKLFINGTEYKEYTTDVLSNNDGSWVDDNVWISKSQSIGNGDYTYKCSTEGKYTITWTYKFNYGTVDAYGTNGGIRTMTGHFFNGRLYAASTTLDIKTIVASNGFRTTLSTTEYAEFIKDSAGDTSMKIVSGPNGISINNGKLEIQLNGAWYNLSTASIDGYNVLILK